MVSPSLREIGQVSVVIKLSEYYFALLFLRDFLFRFILFLIFFFQVCRKPLGLASRVIQDKQISASSMHVVKGVFGFTTARWKPSNARLHNRGRIHGWIPARFDKRPWIQV